MFLERISQEVVEWYVIYKSRIKINTEKIEHYQDFTDILKKSFN